MGSPGPFYRNLWGNWVSPRLATRLRQGIGGRGNQRAWSSRLLLLNRGIGEGGGGDGEESERAGAGLIASYLSVFFPSFLLALPCVVSGPFSHPSEAAPRTYHLHPIAAGRVGSAFCKNPLPRYIHARRGCPENQPAGIQSPGLGAFKERFWGWGETRASVCGKGVVGARQLARFAYRLFQTPVRRDVDDSFYWKDSIGSGVHSSLYLVWAILTFALGLVFIGVNYSSSPIQPE